MAKTAAAAVSKQQEMVSLIRLISGGLALCSRNGLMVLPSCPPLFGYVIAGPGKGEEPSGGNPPPDSDRLARRSFKKISPARQVQLPSSVAAAALPSMSLITIRSIPD